MVNPQTILRGISTRLEAATALSTVLTRESDPGGVDGHVDSPFGDLQIVADDRLEAFNTDRVGYVTDDAGNRVGQRFAATFDADLQLDVYVAAGDDRYNATDLGYHAQRVLRQYDTREQGQLLPDPDGNAINDIEDFGVGDGRRADDLTDRPGIRRWRQDLTVEFTDEITAAISAVGSTPAEPAPDGEAAYVATVDTPAPGDLTGGDGDTVQIEYVPADFAGETP